MFLEGAFYQLKKRKSRSVLIASEDNLKKSRDNKWPK